MSDARPEPDDPTRGRLFAVGDIHGCDQELGAMLAAIDPQPADKVVFLGDYVDRGPSPKGVIDRLIDLRDAARCQVIFLRGNHEDMFLSFLGEHGSHGEAFLFNGGRTTLASYGVRAGVPRNRVPEMLPAPHLEFLRALELCHVVDPYVFVHAGISPLHPLEQQREEDLLWIREEFIRNRHRLSKTVIFGHTPQREVLWHLPYKIGLDTGCVYGNKLSCLELTSGVLLQVDRDTCSVTRRSAPAELPIVQAA
jgi:diadenosine tetraphosphatase ApaH/serine/threonine PP2A family protein phosphatase